MQLNHDRLAKHPSTLRRRWGPMLGDLARDTHFDWEELESLCFVFHKLTRGTKGRMSRRQFIDIMSSALDMTHYGNVDYSYRNFDPNNNSYISMEDWCKGLSVVLRGTLDEKISFCFETYDRHREKSLKRKNLIWTVTENWKAAPDVDCQVQVEELLETVLSSVASDPERGITKKDYSKAVHKYPMLLQLLGEALPARPAVTTFLATMMPRAPPYAWCPEHRTERERLWSRPQSSLETMSRLGGITMATRERNGHVDTPSTQSITVPD